MSIYESYNLAYYNFVYYLRKEDENRMEYWLRLTCFWLHKFNKDNGIETENDS